MEDKNLLKLYDIYYGEGLTLFKGYEQRLSFYTYLLFVIAGGIASAFLSVGLKINFFVVFALGIILIIGISEMAIWSLKRLYDQLLENITVRAKIEYDLGLVENRKEKGVESDPWDGWIPEPYIIHRYINNRGNYKSSEHFTECEGSRGYQHKITLLIRGIYIFLIVLLILSICIA